MGSDKGTAHYPSAYIEYGRLSRSYGRGFRLEVYQQTTVLQALHGARDGFAAVADAHGKLFTAIAPGQSAVFYVGRRVVGGSFIASQRGIGMYIAENNKNTDI